MIPDARAKYLKTFYFTNRSILCSDVLAVCDKESSGVEYFTNADSLFKQNLRAAQKITGLSEKDILSMVTLPGTKNNLFHEFMFQKFGVGTPTKYIKFRCEPSIFKIVKGFKEFTLKEKFLLACSVGVGQKLLYYYLANSKKPKSQWMPAARAFSMNVEAQIREVISNMSWWLLKAKGDKTLAFSYYNAGGGIKQSTQYGIAVNNLTQIYKKYD